MPVIHVTDADDPALSDYRGLTDVALRRSLEAERGLYMAEGAKVIERAVRAGHSPRSLLMTPKWVDGIVSALGDTVALGDGADEVRLFVAPDEVLEQVTGYQVHRGALAAMHRPPLPTVADLVRDARRVVVLEGIVDHTNVGAIFRSVAGIGADAIIVSPTCADPLYRRSVKVSMGTVFQVPWTRAESWPGVLDDLRREGFVVAGMALEDGAVPLDKFALKAHDKVALVMGTEGDGMTREALAHVDVPVVIPMAGGVDSLNVAAASAVALWELRIR